MNSPHIPIGLNLVSVLAPAADAAGRTGSWISLKGVKRAWLVFYADQGNAATIAVSINQASAVAGTGSKVITNAIPIWANQDAATNAIWTKATDAVNFTTSAAVKKKFVVFELDPATLDLANSFDCVTLITGASNAANITSGFALLEPRLMQATVVDAMLD